MLLFAELEPVARGFYTGSFGWLGASGDLCLNIIIRSLWVAEGRAFVQAGAGVVADSVPAREYAEAWRKAQAPLLAAGDLPAIGRAVRRSAELHARHIAGNRNGTSRSEMQSVIKMLGLEARMEHRPYELSGGERQMLSLGALLVAGPHVEERKVGMH